MKFRRIIIIILLAVPFGSIALAQGAIPNAWETVAEGIEYQEFRLNEPVPVNIFVARMDRSNANTTIESSIAQGRLSGGTETVSNMAERYDDALNFWGPPTIPVSSTWGSTNQVVVAINGYYYGAGIEPSGVPWSGQIHSGWYAKRFYDNESSSGFIWKMDRNAFIGGCISHPNDPASPKQYVHTPSGHSIVIDGINVARDDDELILYTPQFDRDTNTDTGGTEVLVEMRAPTYTSVYANMPYGIVRKIRQNQGSSLIPFDYVVLSGQDDKAQELIARLNVGDEIGIAQRVKDCTSEPTNVWDKAYAGVGGHWRFLRNGVIYPFTDDGQAIVRDPRTAIAYNSEYIYFIVADGRNVAVSEGMTVGEMADFAKNTLGATDAIMQDGGGSSTMVINGVVVNNSYCNNEYCTPKIYLPLVVKSSSGAQQIADKPQLPPEPLVEWDAEAQVLQRLVANGMLMVVVQPEQKSGLPYDLGDPVTTLGMVDVRLGPGTNYAVLTTLEADGTIMAPLNKMGGIFAKGFYWWKVDFGNIEGWVSQESIVQQLKIRDSITRKPR